jgi:hypothetical protein
LDDEALVDGGDVDKDGDDDDTTLLVMSNAAAEYSIEGLRREVRRGRRDGNWTPYESKSPPQLTLFVEQRQVSRGS